MAAFVEKAYEDEKRTGRNAVTQHLINSPVETHLREREDTEDDETEMAYRGVGDQLLHIRLYQRDQRAVEDADDCQHHDPAGVFARGIWEERQTEADQSVGAHFQHDGCQHDGARGGRLDVRIGQPGVQREKRDLDGEGYEEGQEQQGLFDVGQRNFSAGEQVQDDGIVEGTRLEIQVQNGGQHQHRAGHGVQEEFDGGVDAAVVPPDANEEVHGHEADFPEYVEEEEVERDENTDEPEFQ